MPEATLKEIVLPKVSEPKTTITVTAPVEVAQEIEVNPIEVPKVEIKETVPAEIGVAYTISNEHAEEIAAKLGAENIIKAVAWLVKHGKITDEQSKSGEPFRFIPVATANKILTETDRFIKAINLTK